MSPLSRPAIVELDWDERNEQHIEEHIDAWLIEELIEGGDWVRFPNYEGHPPEHSLFIGRAPGGPFVTAVLRDLGDEAPGTWRPITGWRSTEKEKRMYRAEQRRIGGKDRDGS